MIKPRKDKSERPPPCLSGALALRFINDDLLPRFHGEALQAACRRALEEAERKKLSVADTDALMKRFQDGVPAPSIGLKSARRWLRQCGFEWHPTRKGGQFVDGHNRPDVVQRRIEVCMQLVELSRRMKRWLFNPATAQWRVDDPRKIDECELVWVNQDESIFYA
jgi:hypothetical protein